MTALVALMTGVSLLAIALAVARLFLGPTQADRIIALDVILAAGIALAAAAALASGRTLYLDVAVGIAIAGFVATIVWARLVDKSPPGVR